jgi:hypothetical protein
MDISKVNNKSHGIFLSWLAGMLVAGILVALAFVFCIDPYHLYGRFAVEGVNTVKPELSRYVEEIKLTQVVKLNPDTLIFGNSRAEVGFDPESPALTRRGFSAYNLAIRGTSIETADRELEYLLQKGNKPERIIIGLDFVDFIQIAQNKAENRETGSVNAELFPVERWFWRFDSLFSMTAIKDSVRTILVQHDEEAAIMTARGFNPMKEYLTLARNEGYFVLFRQKAEEYAKTYMKKSAGNLDKNQLKVFRRMLENAVNTDSEVTVVIYPYHAQILALFEETGLLAAFDNWKREVVAEVSDLLLDRKGARISIIDFSGYGSYQCESIPEKGDHRSATRWYWEAGHFKKALGDVAMEQILFLASTSELNSQDQNVFGVKLSQANFNANFERMGMERAQCAKSNPQLFEEIKTLVQTLTKN